MRPVKATGWKLIAADAIDVVDGEPNHVANLMVVQSLDDGGDEDNLHAGCRQFSMSCELGLHQALSRARGDRCRRSCRRIAGRACASPASLAFCANSRFAKLDAVGGRLNVGESQSRCAMRRISKKCGWSVGSPPENCTTRPSTGRSRASVSSMPRICSRYRLVQIARGVGVGKAYRTRQIAAVGQVDVGQRRVRGVHAAEAAIVRTRLAAFDCGFSRPRLSPKFHSSILR